jgi:hypothetical protein
MTWWTARRGVQALAASLIFVAGIGTGWTLWRPKPPKVEAYAPEKLQADGSLVLERKPQPDARPAHEIPKGAKLERVVQVQVKPRVVSTPRTGAPHQAVRCDGAASPCAANSASIAARAGPWGLRWPCAHWWTVRGLEWSASASAWTPPRRPARDRQGSGRVVGRAIKLPRSRSGRRAARGCGPRPR